MHYLDAALKYAREHVLFDAATTTYSQRSPHAASTDEPAAAAAERHITGRERVETIRQIVARTIDESLQVQ